MKLFFILIGEVEFALKTHCNFPSKLTLIYLVNEIISENTDAKFIKIITEAISKLIWTNFGCRIIEID
jgi:hypothetical protein